VALTIVVVVMSVLGVIAVYAVQLAYHQKRLASDASGRRAKIHYRAYAAFVESCARIRINHTAGLVNAGGGTDFDDDNYDPAPKDIDTDGDGTNDARFDIGRVENAQTKARRLTCTGLDD
jgi:hypothetical protein